MSDRRSAVSLLLAAVALVCAAGVAQAASGLGWELRGFVAPEFAADAAAGASAAWFLPPVSGRSALRMVHLLGLCLGLGTALLLDGSVLMWRRAGHAPANAARLLSVGGHVVVAGFGLLWASGVALVGLAVEADPAFLANPKIWAKVLIVTALTANAMVLHARVLPAFALSAGRPIDGRWRSGERTLFVACGAVSSASWGLAFGLGALPEWNYTAPFGAILVLWLIGMLMAAVAIQILMPAARNGAPYRGPDRRRRAPAPASPAPSRAEAATEILSPAPR